MKKNRNRKAFTIAEIMVVIIIIGLLATMVTTSVFKNLDKAKVTTTKANLRKLHTAVVQFKMETGRFPTEEDGLMALIEQPSDVENYDPSGYLQSTDLPTDAWNNEFVYQRYPESGKAFVIISYGADGEPGGEEYDTDLNSTDAK